MDIRPQAGVLHIDSHQRSIGVKVKYHTVIDFV